MQQQNSNQFAESIKKIVTQASRQKLLPKIIWSASKEFGNKKQFNYQKSIKHQYENQLKTPVKYDPEAAKSDQQKFRQKIIKLVNNQLDIDYFENVKTKKGHIVTYKGHQIESQTVPTKKQFQMFKGFNQARFKQTYSGLFDDKLELGINDLYQKQTKRSNTLGIMAKKGHKTEPSPDHYPSNTTNVRQATKMAPLTKNAKTKSLRTESVRKPAILYFNQKKMVGKLIAQSQKDQKKTVLKLMQAISECGGRIKQNELIDRKDLADWLKLHYDRSHRILDFLQVNLNVDFDSFWGISKRLRVMPLQHVLFMAFLYYDHNNDGYICDYDLQIIMQLSLRRPALLHDYQKIKQSRRKKFLTKIDDYIQLYKWSTVTQSGFFDWKRNHLNTETKITGIDLQMKNRINSSKQRHIFLDFSEFCKIYRNDHPFIWYDLIYVLGGIKYMGLKYEP